LRPHRRPPSLRLALPIRSRAQQLVPILCCLLSASTWPACAVGCRQNGS
jgi:hypothetical protein